LNLFPTPIWYMLGGMFAGIGVGALMSAYGFRVIYGKRALIFEEIYKRQFGFDGWKLLHWVAGAFFTMAAVVSIHAMTVRLSLTPGTLLVKRLFAWSPEVHPLSEVQRLVKSTQVKAPAGNIVSSLNYAIVFTRGHCWDSTLPFEYDDSGQYESFFKRLADATGRPVESVDLLPACSNL